MKQKKTFICKECGAQSPKWLGKCPECNSWGSLEEQVVSGAKGQPARTTGQANIIKLKDVPNEPDYRFRTSITELDRVLGGGIIPGSIILVGGDPGIGKSTLMLQMCGRLQKFNPLYITGEESLQQIKYRAQRLKGIENDMSVMADTLIENINAAIQQHDGRIIIIDSIQSVYSERVDATPGSVAQVRECTSLLMQTAKKSNKAVFVVGHVTKEGVIAGPKILEHMVDTVLQFEGEKTYSYRILRAHKNRYGSTNEIGIFEMSDKGLREVSNPSELFLAQRRQEDSGIAIVAAIEGTRPILLEVQALVSPTGYSVPQRTTTGFDMRRLQMILAVLEKRLGAQFRQADVFVNVAGGCLYERPVPGSWPCCRAYQLTSGRSCKSQSPSYRGNRTYRRSKGCFKY